MLIAYFSYSGTTKGVANAISEKIGANLFEIKTKKEYSNVYIESNREIRKNEKPELADAMEEPEAYDIVFVGASDLIRTKFAAWKRDLLWLI